MRLGSLLVREPADRYTPIGVHGQAAADSHLTLKAALQQRFGAAHAACLARPDRDPRDETIGWHADLQGEARCWADLAPEEQARLAPVLERFRADFRAYADSLRGQSGTLAAGLSAQSIAALLDQAVQVPDERHLHFVGEQPVLSFWGFRHADGRHLDALGLRPPAVAAPAAVAPVAAAAARPWWRWLLWLLPLLLLALVLLWLLWSPGCEAELPPEAVPEEPAPVLPEPERGVEVVPGTGRVVPAVPGATGPGGATADGMALPEGAAPPEGAETPPAGEERAPPPEPEAPIPEAPPPEPPAGEDGAAEEPEPPPPPPQDAPRDMPEDGSELPAPPLEIPADAAASGDTGFLRGQWRSRRDLVDAVTGEPLEQTYRFGEDGSGEAVIRRSDGVECRAPVQGRFADGGLVLEEQGALTCPDGRSFDRAVTRCDRTASGVTACRGRNPDGSGYRVELEKME